MIAAPIRQVNIEMDLCIAVDRSGIRICRGLVVVYFKCGFFSYGHCKFDLSMAILERCCFFRAVRSLYSYVS